MNTEEAYTEVYVRCRASSKLIQPLIIPHVFQPLPSWRSENLSRCSGHATESCQTAWNAGELRSSTSSHALSLTARHVLQYIMMQNDETMCDAAMRAIKHFDVPVYGLPGTLHETFAAKYNIPFIPEAFVDVNYSNDGALLGVPGSREMSVEEIHNVTKQLGKEGVLPSVDHKLIDVGVGKKPFTLCLHSDFVACRENVAAARKAVDAVNQELYA
jgi:lactam utilization protein B